MAGKRILVVDDDPDVRLMFRLIFESAGYQVGEARNGVAALILIKDSTPDLVVTDMVMPGMDGQELIMRIRSDERTAQVPILAVATPAQGNWPPALTQCWTSQSTDQACSPRRAP